jgi:protein phosphatase
MLISRSQNDATRGFLPEFLRDFLPYENRYSDIWEKVANFARINQSTVLMADSTSLYLGISPGHSSYAYSRKANVRKSINPERFTALRAPYSLLPSDYHLLLASTSLKEDSGKLEKSLDDQPVANVAQLDHIRNQFSISGPMGLLSIRTDPNVGSQPDGTIIGSIHSDRGLVRPVNEDSGSVTGVNYSDGTRTIQFTLVAVADGVGGLAGGEIASKIAVSESVGETVSGLIHDSNIDTQSLLRRAFDTANQKITNVTSFTKKSMGSTLSMSLLKDNEFLIANAGDTRVYLIQPKKQSVDRLTIDHRLMDGGIPTHVITRSLGSRDHSPDINGPKPLDEESWFLTCTDGVHESVDDNEILEQSIQNANPLSLCKRLIQVANLRGGKDNLTIAAVSCKKMAAG